MSLKDGESSFGKEYLKLLVDEIKVKGQNVYLRGSYAALADGSKGRTTARTFRLPCYSSGKEHLAQIKGYTYESSIQDNSENQLLWLEMGIIIRMTVEWVGFNNSLLLVQLHQSRFPLKDYFTIQIFKSV
jgi:hypothetical protein